MGKKKTADRIVLEISKEQGHTGAKAIVLEKLLAGAQEVALRYLWEIHGGVRKQGYRTMKRIQELNALKPDLVKSKGKNPGVSFKVEEGLVIFNGQPTPQVEEAK